MLFYFVFTLWSFSCLIFKWKIYNKSIAYRDCSHRSSILLAQSHHCTESVVRPIFEAGVISPDLAKSMVSGMHLGPLNHRWQTTPGQHRKAENHKDHFILYRLPWWPCGLRRCHWLLDVSRHCLDLNPGWGMWWCYQWLAFKTPWSSPGTPVSSASHNWLVKT